MTASGMRYALLIGVARYESSAFDDLEVARRDTAALSGVLEDLGYEVEAVGAGDEPAGRASILLRLRAALSRVQDGASLLVYFSGHGLHYEDASFLVPSDCPSPDEDPTHLADYLVPLDTVRLDSSSPAKGLLVLVDACRDGVKVNSKAPGDLLDLWTAEQTARAVSQGEARIFGCSPGERCRYENSADGLSLFTRALIEVLKSEANPDLTALARATQARLDLLTNQLSLPRQTMRIELNQDLEQGSRLLQWFTPEIGRSPSGEAPMRRLLSDIPHKSSEEERAVLEAGLKQAFEYGLDVLGEGSRWCGPDYERRVAFEIRRLTAPQQGAEQQLSPIEIYVLALAFRARELFVASAAGVITSELQLGRSAEGAAAGARAVFPALGRKLDRLIDGDQELHRDLVAWIAERHALDHRATFEDAELRAAVESWLLAIEPNNTRRAELADVIVTLARSISASSEELPPLLQNLRKTFALDDEWGLHECRPHVLAHLLACAGGLAVDARLLSEVVPAQIGLRDGLNATDVREALEAARWVKSTLGWDLDLTCAHPAIDMALREWVDRTNGVLDYAGKDEQLRQAVPSMVYHVSSSLLRPAEENDIPAYSLPHVSFHLSTDETRELLMGSELYGDPNLAFRELYQNALDACKYRNARLRYLDACGILTDASWRGRIIFTIGEEDGRPFVECRDNGIGMGRQELDRAFARAGVRFQDLPEFVDEYYEWRKHVPDLVWSPTSRFGIGVFSYFMVAEEIEVETSRVSPMGRPEQTLKVDIAGSGALFRVRPLAQSALSSGGTRIRLFLSGDAAQDPGRCGKLLQSLLRIVEFETVLRSKTSKRVWSPGNVYIDGEIVSSQRGTHSRVYWINGLTERVVDGIAMSPNRGGPDSVGFVPMSRIDLYNEETLLPARGCIANLGGGFDVRLSVDRLTIRAWPEEDVARAVRDSVSSLPTWDGLTYDWLWSAGANLELLEEMEEVFVRAEVTVDCKQIGAREVAITDVAIVPADSYIVSSEFEQSATVENWFGGARLATWLSAGAELGVSSGGPRVVVPNSLQGYPKVTARIGKLFEQTLARNGALHKRDILQYARRAGVSFGECARDLRRYSMLSGERPRLVLGPLAEAREGTPMWEALELLPDHSFYTVLWAVDTESRPREQVSCVDVVEISEADLFASARATERSPKELVELFQGAGATIKCAGDGIPAWALFDRPLNATEMHLIALAQDGLSAWHGGNVTDFIGRLAFRVPNDLPHPQELVETLSSLAGEESCLLAALASCADESEVILTCQAIVHGLCCGANGQPRESESSRVMVDAAVIAKWSELRVAFPEIDGIEAPASWHNGSATIEPSGAPEVIRRTLSRDLDGMAPFLNSAEIPFEHVVAVASRLRLDLRDVLRQLETYGKQEDQSIRVVDRRDLEGVPPAALLRLRIAGSGREALPEERVQTFVTIMGSAVAERCQLGEMIERVSYYLGDGLSAVMRDILAPGALVQIPTGMDADLVQGMQLDRELPVTPLAIARAALAGRRFFGETLDLARRWVALSVELDASDERLNELNITARHVVALSRDLDGNDPWVGRLVDGVHLLRLAARLGVPIVNVLHLIEPFEGHGMCCPELDPVTRAITPSWTDLSIASDWLDVKELHPDAERDEIAATLARSSDLSLHGVSAVLERLEPLLVATPTRTEPLA